MQANYTQRFLTGPNPPLRCDEGGHLRIHIVGNSGVGKSTIASELATILQLPVIHLDSWYFQPNWKKTPKDEFREKVQSFMRDHDSWVVDGSYNRLLDDLVHTNATCILWLDPPFVLYFSRLVIRTFLRLLGLAPPCSPGCEERWGEVFSVGKQSIVWWCWTNHTPVKKKCTSEMQESGDEGGKWVRLGGWGGEVDAWIKRVESFAKAQ